MILFGLGNVSKIMLIIWIIVFQMILSVRDGVMQIPISHFKVMNSFSASTKQQFRYLIIPAILPQVFSGLRISIWDFACVALFCRKLRHDVWCWLLYYECLGQK